MQLYCDMSDQNASSQHQDPQEQISDDKQGDRAIEPKYKKCIVLSLIRHGQVHCQMFVYLNSLIELISQSESNATGNMGYNDPLTSYGRMQAQQLGKGWENVHIDALYSSTLQRAHDTAFQISAQSKAHTDPPLKLNTSPLFIEREAGEEVIALARAGRTDTASEVYMGVPIYQTGPTPRDYRPPRGGESPNDVADRAALGLKMLLLKHGKDLDEPPTAFVDKMKADLPDTLPNDIPHVVVVSHNIFLSELYERMLGWNTSYRMTTCNYSNTAWSASYTLHFWF